MSHLGWCWTQWLTLILALFFLVVYFFTLPETYAPVLLTRRAKKLRRETGNLALHTLTSERKIKVSDMGRIYVLKPWIMLDSGTDPGVNYSLSRFHLRLLVPVF